MKLVRYVTFMMMLLFNQSFGSTLVADAGSDQTLNITPSVTAVYLDGSGSSSDAEITSYKWSEGDKYIGPNEARWYVIKENGEHTITLKVTDATGATSEDTMVVTVVGGVDTPFCNAGLDQTLNITPSVRAVDLNASISIPTENIVSINWWEDDIFIGPNKTRWYDLTEAGEHTITLKVTDIDGKTCEDSMVVTVVTDGTPAEDTIKPVISLLGNTPISIVKGTVYTDAGATANDNKDGDISANIQVISDVNSSKVGSYTVKYNVSDQAGNDAIEIVRTVTVVSASLPVANAGANQALKMVNGGINIQLDGSNSVGNALTYTWSFVSKPSQSSASLNNATTVNPTFTADMVGTYLVQLIVNNGTVDSIADTVKIMITPVPVCVDPTTLTPEFD